MNLKETSMSLSTFQIGLLGLGLVTLVAVWGYNRWQSHRLSPRQPRPEAATQEPQIEPAGLADPVEPVLEDSFDPLPLPDRKVQLDALIDALATIELDQPVSGDAVLAAMPATRRVGTKPFAVEGCLAQSGQWGPIVVGERYSALQCGVQLANRVGPINEIEYSEFVVKTQALAEALGGSVVCAEMLQEVARGRELDQFASAHDAQLSFTLVARAAAWSPGYIHQHASRLGFVAGAIPGRMVLASPSPGLPPVLSLSFDTQAALAEDPEHTAVRALVISLDVPQVPSEEQPFARMRDAARTLAQQMDGVITDGAGTELTDEVQEQIAQDLLRLYHALAERELHAGSLLARRLFA